MKIVASIFLLFSIIIQLSCGGDRSNKPANEAVKPVANTGESNERAFANIRFASAFDTSCGMPLTAGIADTLHVSGKVYGFCSKECKDEFANTLIADRKR